MRGAFAKASGALAFASWIGLAILVVLLARENRELEAALARSAVREAPPQDADRFAPGERFRPLALRAPGDGSVTHLAFDGTEGRTLLLVFADACAVCPSAFLAWEELAAVAQSAGVRVVGLCLDARTELAAGPAGVPVFGPADLSTLPLDKLRTVPSTVLLDPFGTIEWLHYGTLAQPHVEALGARL